MSLRNFILEVRQYDQKNPTVGQISIQQWEQAVSEALQRYSRLPNKGRERYVNIEVRQGHLSLPDDYFYSEDLLKLIPNTRAIPGSYPSNGSVYQGQDYPLSATAEPVNAAQYYQQIEMPIVSTDDLGRKIVYLPAEVNIKFSLMYIAIHQITDNPDRNTVPNEDRWIVKRLTIGCALEALARDILKNNPEGISLAKELQQSSKTYFDVEAEESAVIGACW